MKSFRFLLVYTFFGVSVFNINAIWQNKSGAAQTDAVLIRNVRIFDGSRVSPANSVLIKDGRIADVGKDIPTASGATVIDGSGDTLLPGLIDAHTHTWSRNFLKEALVFGVTTEFDMFTGLDFLNSIKKERSEGKDSDIADLHSCGTLVTSPGGHGTEYQLKIPTINAPEEAQQFVDARIAEGSEYIKIIYEDGSGFAMHTPTISKETMAAVAKAAHERGKLAVAHIGSRQGANDAINAGVDGLMHIFGDQPPDPDFGSLAASHHVFVVPTLTVVETFLGHASGASLITDPNIGPDLSPTDIINLKISIPKRPGNNGDFQYALDAVRRLKESHVPILAGTDAPNPGTWHGASIHRELELLVQAGLTPTEALTAATSASAAAFRFEDRGRIAPGLRADLLLVKGDPTTDIKATRAIEAVWKLGVRVDRAGYRAEATKARAIAEMPPAGSESGLISDFEDGTTKTLFGTGWRNVGSGQSSSEMKVIEGGAQNSKGSLLVTGEIIGGGLRRAGVHFNPGKEPFAPANLSSKKEISFWAKGDGKTYQLLIVDLSLGAQPGIQKFVAGTEWKEYTFPLSAFGTNCHDLTGIVFAGGPELGRFSFQIDDVRFR